eukprot:gnl/TRDRNA2_/TRDRNA2_160173_c0_seq1.p1 gnl/TRDRNA2_/TRDRNA2_160173_c0~~gnl/TRDRNA2_/TRDRNA2_160173_c0_seq1.p1  ORF type:complete len:188 (-),score=45.35 gnl/TRDRNA2_/TRDRNA2_160173_c0_seq1:112-642(-)
MSACAAPAVSDADLLDTLGEPPMAADADLLGCSGSQTAAAQPAAAAAAASRDDLLIPINPHGSSASCGSGTRSDVTELESVLLGSASPAHATNTENLDGSAGTPSGSKAILDGLSFPPEEPASAKKVPVTAASTTSDPSGLQFEGLTATRPAKRADAFSFVGAEMSKAGGSPKPCV